MYIFVPDATPWIRNCTNRNNRGCNTLSKEPKKNCINHLILNFVELVLTPPGLTSEKDDF